MFQYPSGPDDQSVPSYNRDQFATVHKAYGSNNPDTLFGPESPTTSTPWPSAPRTKGYPSSP